MLELVAFWTGAAVCALFSLYVYTRYARFADSSAATIQVYRLALASSSSKFVGFFLMGLAALPGAPLGTFDYTAVMYVEWLVNTPLLLMQLVRLRGMGVPRACAVFFIAELMVVLGWGAEAASESATVWGFIAGSFCAMLALFGMIYDKLTWAPDVNTTKKTYRILALLLFCSWTVIGVLMSLGKAGLVGRSSLAVAYVASLLTACVLYGLLALGGRDADAGKATLPATITRALVAATDVGAPLLQPEEPLEVVAAPDAVTVCDKPGGAGPPWEPPAKPASGPLSDRLSGAPGSARRAPLGAAPGAASAYSSDSAQSSARRGEAGGGGRPSGTASRAASPLRGILRSPSSELSLGGRKVVGFSDSPPTAI